MLLTTMSPVIASLLLLAPSLTSAACSTFLPLSSRTTFTTLHTYAPSQTERISNTINCPSNASYCYVGDNNSPSPSILPESRTAGFTILRTQIGGQATTVRTIAVGQLLPNGTNAAQGYGYNYTINPTLSNTSALWDLISASTNDTAYLASYTQNVQGSHGQAVEIRGGQSGWFAYVPEVVCVRGVLSGCMPGGNYAVGQDTSAVIQACAPQTGDGFLPGSVTWQKEAGSDELVIGVTSGAGSLKGSGVLALASAVVVGVVVAGVM